MRRSHLLLLALPAALGAYYFTRSTGTAVFLVSLDTVRADRLGCYGYAAARTPFIDSLATRGTLFENAISSASFTPASHASIFTGLYPPRHGVRFLWGYEELHLKPSVRTLAESFRDAGYRTAAFISSRPLQKKLYGLDRGFELYEESFLESVPRGERKRVSQLSNQRRADETLEEVAQWIESQSPENFFAFIHLFDAHDAQVDPPPEFKRQYMADIGSKEAFNHYDYEIAWMDAKLREFFDRIAERLRRHSVEIILVGDHGQGLTDHGYPRHGERLYQEQIRVPLIWVGEGMPAGARIETIVRTVDIAPTATQICGAPSMTGIDGRGLTPVVNGTDAADRSCYSESLHPLSKDRDALFAVIVNRRKLIHAPQSARFEYYDLRTDPAELNDLSATGDYSDLLEELKKFDLSTDFARSRGGDADVEEGLRELGYIN